MRAPRALGPSVFAILNAAAFFVIRPGVPDLWAARARASAVGHGVGLGYWFSWFGGSTPGNYSVITPYLCALLGTEFVAAAATVALTALATVVARSTTRPVAAAWVAAFGAVVNLWCGRVPFLLGSALAVGALVFVRRRAKLGTAVLSVLAALASPVAGAFLCLGLSGVVLARRMRDYRVVALVAAASTCAALVTLAVVFGVPGPEPLPLYLIGEIVLVLALLVAAAPPDHLRITLAVCAAATLVLIVVPSGMGANFVRLVLFCLPPAAVALSRRRTRLVAALTVPILVLSAASATSAVLSAARPSSDAAYYAPLAAELDALPAAADYRVELVSSGHAAYTALLDHAVLARGWETQEDRALNSRLDGTLDADRYRAWLDDNAVGYVALNLPGGPDAEGRLVTTARPRFLHPIWRSAHWELFVVRSPRPIVATPGVLTASTQAALTVHIPCSCRIGVRVRWSKFLSVAAQLSQHTADTVEDAYRPTLGADRNGWTTVATNRPGTYVLSGSL